MARPEPAPEANLPTSRASVVALRSSWSSARLGKAFHCGDDGQVRAEGYQAGAFFRPEIIPVDGIRSLHAAWSRLARAGDAMLVRGGLSGAVVPAGTPVRPGSKLRLARGHITRRTQQNPDGHAPGLVDTPQQWVLIDGDGIPNLRGLDPRTHPEEAIAFVAGLLPPELGRATLSADWSSSACVGLAEGEAPALLDLHLRLWLDAPIGQAEARTLLWRLNEHAWRRLERVGAHRTGKAVIDPKVSEPQQPMYVASPRFEGLPDPFPGDARCFLRHGVRDMVRLALLQAQLDAAGIPYPEQASAADPKGRRTPARTSPGTAARARASSLPSLPPLPEGGADVVPLAAAKRLREAQEASRKAHRRYEVVTCRRVDRKLFAARGPLEMVRVCRGRAELGATDPRWRSWHAAGGVPDGQRDMVLFMIGCLVVESLGPEDLVDDARVNARILELGRLIMDPAWIEAEWLGGRYYRTLVARAVAAGRGATEVWQGVLKDTRYRVGKARLLRELTIGADEVARYELVSLATDRDRLAARRKASRPRVETQAANVAKVRRAKRMMAVGKSRRAAATAVGMDEAQLRRMLKAEACEPKVRAKADDARRTRSVLPASADNSSASREEKVGREGEIQATTPQDPLPAPAHRGRPLAFHLTLVGMPAVEAAATVRARSAVTGRPLPVEATLRKAYRASLSGLTTAEASARLKARRRAVWCSQADEIAVTKTRAAAEGWDPARLRETLVTLGLRHQNHWAAENRLRLEVLAGAVGGIVPAAFRKGRLRWGSMPTNPPHFEGVPPRPDGIDMAIGW